VTGQVLVESARVADQPRLVADRLGACHQDVGILRQASAADEAGAREIRSRVVHVGRADELHRIEREPLGQERHLVAEGVDQSV
jgi:hypothetical protein